MGLANIPQSKWGSGTGRQVILKNDFAYIEQALIELAELPSLPELVWSDNTAVKVPATSDCKARLLMSGFPSPLHRNLMVHGGLSDGKYRENASETMMSFATPTHLWGTEKTSQWYAIYAIAADVDTTFTLKAMPLMRHSSQTSQVITLRNNANSGDIGYGFTTDALKDGKILILTGASRGLIRTITANNNNNSTGGTVTYSGSALSLAQGDWFVVLPPGVNFRYLGMIFNNSAGNIQQFVQKGRAWQWVSPLAWITGAINGWTEMPLDLVAPLTARQVFGIAHADYGYTLKLALSADGTTWNQLLHAAYPGSGFKATGASTIFSFLPRPNHTIYVDNENTSGQHAAITGWEE